MGIAIESKAWKFLEDHFQEREERAIWTGRKRVAEEENQGQQPRPQRLGPGEIKIYQLSRTYPMFNDMAIPNPKLEDVYIG